MTSAVPPSCLSAETGAFIESGLSITLAARDERLVPSIAKAVGCRVEQQGRRVAILLFADAAEAVCRDIARNGLVAACFSRPSTSRTVQIKGHDAQSTLATPPDVATARRYLDLLIDDLVPMGFARSMLEAFFWGDTADLMVIRFTPAAAFAQTPGPGAGRALSA